MRAATCRGGFRRGADAKDEPEDPWQVQLSLWCLNPACIFREIGEQARSVILTSGTLSPMTSFASELGIPFAWPLEAPHVVPQTNVRAAAQTQTIVFSSDCASCAFGTVSVQGCATQKLHG